MKFWILSVKGALWSAGCVGTMLFLDFGDKGDVKLTADDGITIWCVMFLWFWLALILYDSSTGGDLFKKGKP